MLLATLFLKPDDVLAGDFLLTCQPRTLKGVEKDDGYYLRARCPNAEGKYATAELRISDYIANYEGNLS